VVTATVDIVQRFCVFFVEIIVVIGTVDFEQMFYDVYGVYWD